MGRLSSRQLRYGRRAASGGHRVTRTRLLGGLQKAGALAYVLKGLVRKELLDTIRAVHRGVKRIQADVAAQIAHHTGEAPLTAREIEVILLAATGNSNKRIGVKLSINEDTVKGHMTSIMAKLGASDRTHAVSLALRRGIIEL